MNCSRKLNLILLVTDWLTVFIFHTELTEGFPTNETIGLKIEMVCTSETLSFVLHIYFRLFLFLSNFHHTDAF